MDTVPRDPDLLTPDVAIRVDRLVPVLDIVFEPDLDVPVVATAPVAFLTDLSPRELPIFATVPFEEPPLLLLETLFASLRDWVCELRFL